MRDLSLNSRIIIFSVYKAKEFIIHLFLFESFITRGKFRVRVLYRISAPNCSLQSLAETAVIVTIVILMKWQDEVVCVS
jgi:hypothetical protein